MKIKEILERNDRRVVSEEIVTRLDDNSIRKLLRDCSTFNTDDMDAEAAIISRQIEGLGLTSVLSRYYVGAVTETNDAVEGDMVIGLIYNDAFVFVIPKTDIAQAMEGFTGDIDALRHDIYEELGLTPRNIRRYQHHSGRTPDLVVSENPDDNESYVVAVIVDGCNLSERD